MRKLGRLLLGLWAGAGAAFWCAFIGSIYILGAPFDRTGTWMDFWQRVFCRMILFGAGVRVRVVQKGNIPHNTACILMGNHRSYLDIPATVVALRPLAVRFVAKRELLAIPFLGWALAVSHHIKIDRSNREQAITALRAARRSMTRGIGLAMFPEGTRSPDHRLLPFKKGGFYLALDTGYPILPFSIQNSGHLFGKKSFLPRPGVITVVVHPMIPTEGKRRGDIPDLMQEVRATLLSALPESRARETEADPESPDEGIETT